MRIGDNQMAGDERAHWILPFRVEGAEAREVARWERGERVVETWWLLRCDCTQERRAAVEAAIALFTDADAECHARLGKRRPKRGSKHLGYVRAALARRSAAKRELRLLLTPRR